MKYIVMVVTRNQGVSPTQPMKDYPVFPYTGYYPVAAKDEDDANVKAANLLTSVRSASLRDAHVLMLPLDTAVEAKIYAPPVKLEPFKI